MTDSILTSLRDTRPFMRSTASAVLVAFVMLILEPAVAAAQSQASKPVADAAAADSDDQRFSGTLQHIEDNLQRIQKKIGKHQDSSLERLELMQLQHTLKQQDIIERKNLLQIEQHLKNHNIPVEVMNRHQAMVDNYQSEYNTLISDIDSMAVSDDDVGRLTHLQSILDRFKAKPNKKSQQLKFDPKKLPFMIPDGKTRPPKETKEELEKLIQTQAAPIQVAALELTAGMLAQPTNNLSSNEDVQITDRINALAKELNNNPVAIYNWVRNNIEFIPTYGSIQGSDLTLLNRRGNAFDTASLLISLLRASNIPARYAYGTIKLPANQVMNWVGGVNTPEAAQNLLGQGNIPTIGIVSGGKITAFKLEHVWVEAFIDYIPSRGAKHKDGDSWIPLDAAFKQYDYVGGMDVKTGLPFDSQNLLNQIQAGATINETEGWVQNINSSILKTALSDYQSSVNTYVNNKKPNPTVGDVLGDKKVIKQEFPILSGSLPYQIVATSSRFAQIPDNLRWKVKLNLYDSEYNKAAQSPQFTVALSLSKLGKNRLSASYVPASETDAQLIQSYAAAKRLPVYLVKEVLKIQIDNTILAEYGAQTMGSPQFWTYTLSKPGESSVEEEFKLVSSVGDQIVFSINGAGVSQDQVSTRYQSTDPNTSLENLNQLAIGYWAREDFSESIIANQFKTVEYRLPSIGMFAQPLSVVYSWGVPRLGSYKSYSVDIPKLINSAVTLDGKMASNFRFQSGLSASHLEGRIFEEIFDLAPGNGFSAVAVIATAISNNVPIWKINSNNLQAFLTTSILSTDVKQQISNAVSAGLDVITPEEGVDVGFWAGQGYIAVDPKTGAGGYILNSANGGEFAACEEKSVPLTESISQQILTYAAIALAAILIATGEIGSGGLATPAIVLAMRILGISVLAWSPTSYAAGKCKSAEKCHRGRIQAQGDKPKLEKSESWAKNTPLTLSEGLALLDALTAKLTLKEAEARNYGLAKARQFIIDKAAQGGACPPDYGNWVTPGTTDTRIDIEINAGTAFIPD